MIVALTREPARTMDRCELTHRERVPIDAGRAARQHRDYRKALRACGAHVVTLPRADELPDSVFVEDTAIVLDEIAVLAWPGVESRRAEVELIEPELLRLRTVVRCSPPQTLEGGDVMRVDRTLYVGLSARTNSMGASMLRWAASDYGYEVVEVNMRGCLHLKTACSALDSGTVLVNPDWVDASAFRAHGVIAVDPSEPWAANVLQVGKSVCASVSYPRTAALLASHDYDVHVVDVSEFAKAEGGMTCMSLLFRQP